MPLRSNAGYVAVHALLCFCVVLSDNAQSHHDSVSNEKYDALFNELTSAGAGVGLEDAKMADLTNSIQGVFATGPQKAAQESNLHPSKQIHKNVKAVSESAPAVKLAHSDVAKSNQVEKKVIVVSRAVPAKKVSQPKVPKAEQVQKNVKASPKHAPAAKLEQPKIAKTAQFLKSANPAPPKVATAAMLAQPTVEKAKQVEKKIQAASKVASLPKTTGRQPNLAGQLADVPQMTKLPIEGKVGHINVSAAVQTKPPSKQRLPGKVGHMNVSTILKENASKVEDAMKSMPMASFALDVPKLAKNKTDDSSVNATKMPVAPPSFANYYANFSNAHSNASVAVNIVNQSQTSQNMTKEIEQAVVSLPMAGFALDEPAPPKNKTEQKFPGNATQKAAFEKKEKFLEKEIKSLKSRLENASEAIESRKQPAPQVATGTFSANVHDVAAKHPTKFMASKGPEPMQPLRKDEKPKAEWPTMASIASPVGLQGVNEPAVPPQKDAIRAQEGSTKKIAMGPTFTGTPAKKVQSVLALDSVIDRNAVVSDDERTEQDAAVPPALGWFASVYSWFFGKPSVALVSEKPVVKQVTAPKAKKAFIWMKQDSERTAQAAQSEHEHTFAVNEAWGQMEEEDTAQEERVRSEDRAEREQAEVVEPAHHPSKAELAGRHGVHMSGFWSNLEKQDDVIAETVHSDDLVKYAELTSEQDNLVSKLADDLDMTSKPSAQDHTLVKEDLRLPIHEPWLRREERDKSVERKIHDSPDLQMLQLSHVRKHV